MPSPQRPADLGHVLRAAVVVLVAVLALAGPRAAALAADDAATPEGPSVPTTVADNPFIPEDANLSDCVSSMPRPECGSDAHGGTPQLLTFGALMLGMAFIGWRIFRGVRRSERERDARVDAADPPARR